MYNFYKLKIIYCNNGIAIRLHKTCSIDIRYETNKVHILILLLCE